MNSKTLYMQALAKHVLRIAHVYLIYDHMNYEAEGPLGIEDTIFLLMFSKLCALSEPGGRCLDTQSATSHLQYHHNQQHIMSIRTYFSWI